MNDIRVKKLAKLLVEYCVEVKKGDYVAVAGETISLPLMRALVEAVTLAGGHIDVAMRDLQANETRMALATDEQLAWSSPLRRTIIEEADVLIQIFGTINTRAMSGVDPARYAKAQEGGRALTERYFERTGSGDLRWVITRFPTAADAQEAEMGVTEYEDFVFKACLLEEQDPLAAWVALREKQQGIVDWLEGKEQVQVNAPGVDLTLSIADRKFVNSDGRRNMPSGEVFTSPIEDSANGEISFSYPSILNSREVDGVSLRFENGIVVDATAAKGQDFLLSQLDRDEGARRMGEFAIGTNYAIDRHTGDILFDEKIGGTMHLALGLGIQEAGGANKSIIHWDMVTDLRNESEILVDGELLYKDGEFKISG